MIPEEYTLWSDIEAIIAMTAAAIGLLATFVTCHIFIRHNNTPVVKASTRELSYLILAGMTLSHFSVSIYTTHFLQMLLGYYIHALTLIMQVHFDRLGRLISY